jgi:hypothetical protein
MTASPPIKSVVNVSRVVGLILLGLLPSLGILTQPFPWIGALRLLALGTVSPIVCFALIGIVHCKENPRVALWAEWAMITFCFACLQAYIYNTALHPDNRFNLIGGLLPNADPSMYLSLASQWQSGVRVVTPQTTRQFFPCFLSTMLWLCNRDLKIIVSLFTLITGGFAFLAWRQVRISLGWLAATLFVTLVFFFYRCECLGMLRTEQLGLWFALVAVALLLQGIWGRSELIWNFGIFSLVMGLNTRAGAYLVVPLFVLYAGWLFRRGRYGWRTMVVTTIVAFSAMVLNAACYWIFFAPPRPISNFWLCLYGMLTGGNWVTALHEIGLDYLKTNAIARDKSLALLKAQPFLVFKGSWRACAYVWNTNTFYGHPPTAEAFRSAMKWLTPIGAIVPWLWALVRRKKPELELLVLLALIGVVCSLPFAPPWDGGHRVFAVTNPFLFLAPAMFLALFEKEIRARFSTYLSADGSNDAEVERQILAVTKASIAVLLLLTIVVPLGLMLRPNPKPVAWERAYCAPPTGGCLARKLPGGFQIHLIPDSGRTFVPWVTVSDFRKSLEGNLEKLRAPWILDVFNELPAGTTIGTAFHSNFFVIATDKAKTYQMSKRHPILNRKWHRIVFDNDYPIPAQTKLLLNRPDAPPIPKGRGIPP